RGAEPRVELASAGDVDGGELGFGHGALDSTPLRREKHGKDALTGRGARTDTRAVIVCPKCTKENQDHYKFCLGCGAELPRDASPKKFAPGTPPHGVPAARGGEDGRARGAGAAMAGAPMGGASMGAAPMGAPPMGGGGMGGG